MILPGFRSPNIVTRIRDYMQNFSSSKMGTVERSYGWTRKAAQGRKQSFRKFRQNEPLGNIFKSQAFDWLRIQSVFLA